MKGEKKGKSIIGVKDVRGGYYCMAFKLKKEQRSHVVTQHHQTSGKDLQKLEWMSLIDRLKRFFIRFARCFFFAPQ